MSKVAKNLVISIMGGEVREVLVYHGSNVVVGKPQIIELKKGRTVDFGAGFYTTTDKEQAEKFGRYRARKRGGLPICNIYEFDAPRAKSELEWLEFQKADEDWLKFVYTNRQGTYDGKDYDIIQGPVADDRVYRTLILYEDGELNIEATIEALKTSVLEDQVLFCTSKALDCLKYVGSEEC